jgi:tRNA-splicing ligase RtcB (3'-phosphate/5'-hydroxy nucleic acid ligase)
MGSIKTFGPVDERSLDQLKRCMDAGDAEYGVLCADHHPGYSQPIGGAVAYEGYVSPSGVGYDIACFAAGTAVTTMDGYSVAIEAASRATPLGCFDGGTTRPISLHWGSVRRGERRTIAIELVNGRRLRLTRDHRVRTRRGWIEAGYLWDDDELLVVPFVGLPHEPFELDPALVRILAYLSGDGHLTLDRKRVSMSTTVEEDAADLVGDLRRLGFEPGSLDLHRMLRDLGSPPGGEEWPKKPMRWLLDAPAWVRALFVSSLASAEMCRPRVIAGGISNLALKQADLNAANFVLELLSSLGFRCSVARSGIAWRVDVLGGDIEKLRFFEQVGFCRAAEKRRAAAVAASVAWQRLDLLRAREEARAVALNRVAVGDSRVGVMDQIAHDCEPHVEGDACWVRIRDIVGGGTVPVWDVVTGDPAESFMAEGVVVHNCGNKAAQTELTRADLDALGGVEKVMSEITRRISFGVGVPAQERVDHPVLDKIRRAEFAPQRQLSQLAESQLGTVGSGNHYVNLMEDEDGHVWVGVHFGSRGFGHRTASGFLALAQGLAFDAKAHEGEMDSPPVLFEAGSELGEAYISAMELAGEYAYAGRDVVVAKVLEILGAAAVHEVHNNHNFAWREECRGRTYWVVRKGCTPAQPGQEGFVGGSMGDESVILEGVESPENEEALYSTVHGAGRVMSRSQAAGRLRTLSVYACPVRDCDHYVPAREFTGGRCPIHDAKLRKVRRTLQLKPGVVDWPAVQARLREQGIVLVGGGADEAPEVYKRLPDVLDAHAGTIRVKHTLRPLGVAMAGRDVYDPYKD